jgi:hypothetical protein
VPFYLEHLGVTKEKPVVPLGGDVQLFSLFEDVLEGLEHGFTMTHLIYAAHSLSHLMGLILRHKEEFWYISLRLGGPESRACRSGLRRRQSDITQRSYTRAYAKQAEVKVPQASLR